MDVSPRCAWPVRKMADSQALTTLMGVGPDWNYCEQVPVSAGAMRLRWCDRRSIEPCGSDGVPLTLMMLLAAAVHEVERHCW